MSYLLAPSQSMKSLSMIVEPYNFTLSFNNIVRSSSMVAVFSNEQTIRYLERFNDQTFDSNFFPVVNRKLADCFHSIFG